MLRTIHLHGSLADTFGPSYRLAVASPAEAIRALCTQLPGLERAIADGGAFRCVVGKRPNKGRALGSNTAPKPGEPIMPAVRDVARELHQPRRRGEEDFHLVPVVRGRGRGGAKIIVGVVLIAAAIMTAGAAGALGGMLSGAAGSTAAFGSAMSAGVGALGGLVSYGTIASLGAMMVLGGIAQAISPQPSTGDYGAREAVDQRASYMFNNVVNTVEQGGAVPLIYGEVLVGSQVIAMGLAPEDMPYGTTEPSGKDGGTRTAFRTK
jgi:predicted phage tail protein